MALSPKSFFVIHNAYSSTCVYSLPEKVPILGGAHEVPTPSPTSRLHLLVGHYAFSTSSTHFFLTFNHTTKYVTILTFLTISIAHPICCPQSGPLNWRPGTDHPSQRKPSQCNKLSLVLIYLLIIYCIAN